jgi:F0F1-type ATP synthase membrane subunit c/vacuolar-type H+-ATPase subunit K
MNASEPSSDPGWGGLGGVLLMMIPIVGHRRVRGADPLIVMRRLFVSFCVAIVLFFVVLSFMDPAASGTADLSGAWAATLAGIVGVISIASGRWFGDRPLDCSSAERLSSSFRERFFMRLAFGEAPALAGFVLVFLSRSLWPYVVGAAFTAIGFAWAAPTRSRIVHDQAVLDKSGCTRNLVTALRGLGT